MKYAMTARVVGCNAKISSFICQVFMFYVNKLDVVQKQSLVLYRHKKRLCTYGLNSNIQYKNHIYKGKSIKNINNINIHARKKRRNLIFLLVMVQQAVIKGCELCNSMMY